MIANVKERGIYFFFRKLEKYFAVYTRLMHFN